MLPRVILVRPHGGGNVGSVCRAMMNMGAADLWIVGGDFDITEAQRMAVHARAVLGVHESLATFCGFPPFQRLRRRARVRALTPHAFLTRRANKVTEAMRQKQKELLEVRFPNVARVKKSRGERDSARLLSALRDGDDEPVQPGI